MDGICDEFTFEFIYQHHFYSKYYSKYTNICQVASHNRCCSCCVCYVLVVALLTIMSHRQRFWNQTSHSTCTREHREHIVLKNVPFMWLKSLYWN